MAGLWALFWFVVLDVPLSTGMVFDDGPDLNRPGHVIGISVEPLDFLIHVGLIILWSSTVRWWWKARRC